jgi:dipeptidyl aminopeptidase/acylaminoacyl peptidase
MPIKIVTVARVNAAVVLLALICSPPLVSGASDSTPRIAPLPVEDVTGMKSFATYQQPAFSTDGEWLAYVLEDPSRARRPLDERYTMLTANGVDPSDLGSDVWITNIRTGESKNITGGRGANEAPAWSPDGRYVAFLSDRGGPARVWLWEKRSGHLSVASYTPIVISGSPVSPLVWTSDSKNIVFAAALPEGMSIEDAIDLADPSAKRQDGRGKDNAGPLVYTAHATAPNDADMSVHNSGERLTENSSEGILDLVKIAVATGKTQHLARHVTPMCFRLSPDGRNVALLDLKRDDFDQGFGHIYDLTRVDLRSGQTKVLVSGIKAAGFVSWSPDSRSIVYATAMGFFLVPADGGTPHQLTNAGKDELDSGQPPLWDESGKTLYVQSKSQSKDILWSVRIADGVMEPIVELTDYSLEGLVRRAPSVDVLAQEEWIYTMAGDRHTHQRGIYRLDLKTHQFSHVFGSENQLTGEALFSPDGKQIIWKQQDAVHPTDLWSSDADFKHPQQLTHNNPDLEEYVFGERRLIGWHTAGGKELHGGVILPVGYQEGTRYPLVVCVYGGDALSGDIKRFSGSGMCGFNLQLLATRGYAVLFADSFVTEKGGRPLQEITESVLPGIDQAVALGIADPERIGVIGHSCGAYSALALITQSSRFKAAVSVDGMSDLFGVYGAMWVDGGAHGITWAETGQGNLGGSPWQYRERYIENSPFFYLDKVQAAVLLIHGTNDGAVEPWLGDQTFVGLRRLSKEVTYVKYRNGGHAPSDWSYADQVDYCNRVIAWFDKYLKSSPKPETVLQ